MPTLLMARESSTASISPLPSTSIESKKSRSDSMTSVLGATAMEESNVDMSDSWKNDELWVFVPCNFSSFFYFSLQLVLSEPNQVRMRDEMTLSITSSAATIASLIPPHTAPTKSDKMIKQPINTKTTK